MLLLLVGATVPAVVEQAERWEVHFAQDQDFEYLISGVTSGFWYETVAREQPFLGYEVENYVPPEHVGKVTTAVERELAQGRVFCPKPGFVTCVSAIGIVDKQRSGFVKHRIVHDLGRPDGMSTNEHARFEKRRFSTVRTAVTLLRPGYFMAKIDISEFYRNFPMAPRHWADLAFKWKVFGEEDARVFVETRMPFGLSPAPGMADRLTSAVVRHMKSKGFSVVGYLDDFLVIGNSEASCLEGYEYLLFFLRDLGFPVNEEKCVLPTRTLIFLGIELSTEGEGAECTMSIDAERVRHVTDAISAVLREGRAPRATVESLAGLLQFVAQVIFGSRLYLRSVYGGLGARDRGARGRWVTLSAQMQRDLSWWIRMIRAVSTNRVVVGLSRRVPDCIFTTDASSHWGMGAFLSGRYFALSWEELRRMAQKPIFPFACEASSHINYLELFTIYWALKLWGSSLRNLCVPLFTDNQAALGMLKNMSSSSAVFIRLLKEIHVMLLRWNLRLSMHYIRSADNVLADSLSRGGEFSDVFVDALEGWRRSLTTTSDFDDWRLKESEVASLDKEEGPFEVDACCDILGSNANFPVFWTAVVDCRKEDWCNRNVYCNPPFSLMFSILLHFLRCKIKCQLGTTATFVLPVWLSHEAIKLVVEMGTEWFAIVRTFEAGTHLFTAPSDVARSTGRRDVGPTRWAVWVVRCPPSRVSAPIPDWVKALL